MRVRFELLFRTLAALLVAALIWSVWASAQAAETTNTVSILTTDAVTVTESRGLPNSYLTFGLDRIDALGRPIAGIPAWQYISSLIYIFLAFYVSKMLDHLIRSRMKKWAERTTSKFDDLLLELVRGPVKVVSFAIFLHIGLQVFDWPQWAEKFIRKAVYVIVAISITYVALKVVDLILSYWRRRTAAAEDRVLDDQLLPIVRHTLKAFVIVIAVLLTSQNLGLDITSLIAVSSVTGLAVGLAAQDTLANLFGAIAVFIDKPFRVGDRIRLDAIDGTVESIGIRSTRVRNLDGHLVTVPNKTMGNTPITNITRRPNIKTVMDIGITYNTPAEKVKTALDILKEVFGRHPKTHDLIISFNRFADSSLNINVIHWWNSTDFKDYMAGIQELNLQVKQRFDSAGIDFAFPTRTLYLKQDSEWRVGGAAVEKN